MPGFLNLPPELIFQVYCSLDTIGDAYFLSQTCQQTYSIFRRPQSQPKIFEAIIVSSCVPSTQLFHIKSANSHLGQYHSRSCPHQSLAGGTVRTRITLATNGG